MIKISILVKIRRMKLDKKQVKNLADLAKLELTDKELDTYSRQLKDILGYVENINKLDLDKIKESLTGVEDNDVGPRPDEVEPSSPGAIKQACQTDKDYVVAPNVFKK